MSRVLVTGGAGFLGSWICDALVEQGKKVICVDNLSSGLISNIAHLVKNDNFQFIQHDISTPIFFDNKIDLILHLASRASPLEFKEFPIQTLKTNTIGTWKALGIAKKHNARVLFTSSSEVYGKATIIPTPEDYNGNVNCIGARSSYDEGKRAGEAMCMAYLRRHDIDVRIARVFNTYGERMRADGFYGRVVPRFVEQALNNKPITVFGNGSQTRSFCYVTDTVAGLLKLAYSEEAKGEVVNIGNDTELTILELANIVKELTKSESEIAFEELPEDDPTRRRPDITKARKLLGWQPKVYLEEGLKLFIKERRKK